ncbi:hypothetical protein D3C86_1341750 [compost metagenome]
MLPDAVVEEIIDHVADIGALGIEPLSPQCESGEFAITLAPEFRFGVEQEVRPSEEAALHIDLAGADFRLTSKTVMHEDLLAVLLDFVGQALWCDCCIVIDDNRVALAVDINIHPCRRHVEAVVRARIDDAIAAIRQRLQPVDLCICRILTAARPLRLNLAVFETKAWLGAPGVPVLNIARGAIPAALHESRTDIEKEKAADEIGSDGEKADEQTISLHETAVEHLRMCSRQSFAVGGVENEAGRHQAAPRPNSKDCWPISLRRSQLENWSTAMMVISRRMMMA